MNYLLNISLIIITIIILIVVYQNYNKIPSKMDHINRNKYNIFPVGQLRHITENKYIDNNNIIWLRRTFLTSLFHNPFKYYVFETYDLNKTSSSEVEVLKNEFDNNYQNFKPATYNYYSSFIYPLYHLFADVIPSFIYLGPEYKIYH